MTTRPAELASFKKALAGSAGKVPVRTGSVGEYAVTWKKTTPAAVTPSVERSVAGIGTVAKRTLMLHSSLGWIPRGVLEATDRRVSALLSAAEFGQVASHLVPPRCADEPLAFRKLVVLVLALLSVLFSALAALEHADARPRRLPHQRLLDFVLTAHLQSRTKAREQ